ncbi:MAG: hypothetical protein QW757_00845 [Candidatus Woesearchaeota archaeon]
MAIEEIIQSLISRYDKTRVVETPEGLKKLHPGDCDYERARPREPDEMPLMKLTRKLFFPNGNYSEPDLNEEKQNALVQWTKERKERAAAFLHILYQHLGYINITQESEPITTELDFLNFLTDILSKYNLPDKSVTITAGDYHTEHSSNKLLREWQSLIKSGKTTYNHFEGIRREAENVPYLMQVFYSPKMPQDNAPFMIFTRVKHSDSANEKLAQRWAEELDLLDRLKLFFEGDERKRGYKDSKALADDLRKKRPENPAYLRHVRSKGEDPNNKSRLDELREGFIYEIEDLFGLTIVLSQRYDQTFVDNLIKIYFGNDSLFVFEKDSLDLHIDDPNKPDEAQFKVRINRKKLVELVGEEYAKEIYVPDSFEIQVISAPDLIIKQLAPFYGERAYKQRMKNKRTKEENAYNYYQRILTFLRNISPGEAIGREQERHIQQIRNNLSRIPQQSGYEGFRKLLENLYN